MRKTTLLFTFIAFIAFSCSQENDNNSPSYLLSSSAKLNLTPESINTNLTLAGFTGLEDELIHNVKVYEIIYKTEYLGEQIEASGLVGVPQTTGESYPMLSFQHGTIASNAEAPTVGSTYGIFAGFASAGYVFLIPDFIGFGASSDVLHPYYNRKYSGQCVLDMVEATMELADQEGFSVNKDLLLAGYSEGGYVTMAAHYEFEQEPIAGVNLIASAPSSGGYYIKGVQDFFFEQEVYDQPFFMAYVMMSYISTGDLDMEVSEF